MLGFNEENYGCRSDLANLLYSLNKLLPVFGNLLHKYIYTGKKQWGNFTVEMNFRQNTFLEANCTCIIPSKENSYHPCSLYPHKFCKNQQHWTMH